MMKRTLLYIGLCGLLTACSQTAPNLVVWSDLPVAPAPSPPVEDEPPTRAPPRDPEIIDNRPEISLKSRALSTYYAKLETNLKAQGLLRKDIGESDAPFNARDLARNFINIALYDEYVLVGDRLHAQSTNSFLRRWDQKVHLNVEFGPRIAQDSRERDLINVKAFSKRLADITGLKIPVTSEDSSQDADFHVLFLTEDDRYDYRDRLADLIPGIRPGALNALVDLPRDQLCVVVAFAEAGNKGYSKAVAIIRGEHPDMLRQVCIHEELAQGLGLANDSLQARPSIFNDDEEFALLTRHDELLLKMLYDPRFKLGMTIKDAQPIARKIAKELLEPPQTKLAQVAPLKSKTP